ncbi:MAG: tRNA threonylcarbamoyladenosine dehydratase [Bacteroidales bacterium]
MSYPDWLQRTELLLGREKLGILAGSHVLVVGLGGVGAYTAEMLCRAGIGRMTIVDGDRIHPTNRNRQLIALASLEGRSKAGSMAERLLDINPELQLTVIEEYIRDERMIEIINEPYDYVVDAIDTLAPKVFLIYHTLSRGHPIVSSMGSGGKMNPEEVRITDLAESYNCRLAGILRKRLHRLGVYSGVKVVFSPEKVSKDAVILTDGEENKKSTVGTISYMPPVFGCFMASVVIRELTGDQ